MKVLFDTSVLVASVVKDLKNHEAALDCFLRYTKNPHKGFCSTHTLAECYSTLTSLPLKRKIQPGEARNLIEQTLAARLTVAELSRDQYDQSIVRVSTLGLVSGVIYDALHLAVAESQSCSRLYTYNLTHFRRLIPERVTISAP